MYLNIGRLQMIQGIENLSSDQLDALQLATNLKVQFDAASLAPVQYNDDHHLAFYHRPAYFDTRS